MWGAGDVKSRRDAPHDTIQHGTTRHSTTHTVTHHHDDTTGNLWLFGPLVKPLMLAKGGATAAFLRTTTATTIVKAGDKVGQSIYDTNATRVPRLSACRQPNSSPSSSLSPQP